MDEKLLNILACPACKGDLKLGKHKLTCTTCKREYAIEEGIPILILKEGLHNRQDSLQK